MNLVEEIQSAVKGKTVVMGFRNSVKTIKNGKPKLVVVASNIQPEMKKKIEADLKSSKIKIEVFEGSSKDLGVVCGKPFPVSALVIRD